MIETFRKALEYAASHRQELGEALGEHLLLTCTALGIAIVLCVPLGVLTSRSRVAALTIINLVNGMRVIPSLAILFLAIPLFGLSLSSSLLAITILALPPVLINSDAAFRGIPAPLLEAARAMGMTARQSLWQVELPLALPVILAGIRTAAVEVIASATLAAFIGGGGLGTFVVLGFSLYNIPILLVGAIPVALLALGAELLFGTLQRLTQPITTEGRP